MTSRASVVGQWLRIHLPTQGTRVWSKVQENPKCHNRAHMPQLLEPVIESLCSATEKPQQWETHTQQWQAPAAATTQSPHAATETQHSQNSNNNNSFFNGLHVSVLENGWTKPSPYKTGL